MGAGQRRAIVAADADGEGARKRSGAQANPRLRRGFGRGPLGGTGRNRQKHLDAGDHDGTVHALSIARRPGRGHLRREAARCSARRVRRARRRQGIEFARVSCFMAGTANRTADFNHLHPVKERNHYDPCIIVIFGGAGDLSHRKLIPALYNLSIDGELPDKFAILGFSMEDLDDEKYRAFALSGIEQFSRRKVENEHWAKFAPMLHFNRGTFTEAGDYENLRKRCEAIDAERGTAGNRAYYFAIPPAFIDTCSEGLTAAGMIHPPEKGHAFTRVVVEKPIGSDLASASEINAELARHFDESQIFRIDHYLGKETVENLMVLRFANAIFEPIWTARFVDHVQITVAETEGVGTRAGYYEHAGALRDMVQSHLLQVLSLLAMEPPRTTEANSVRDAKLDVLRTLRPFTREDVDKWVVRGQYTEGLIRGQHAKGYWQVEHVAADSKIETFVSLKCFIEN